VTDSNGADRFGLQRFVDAQDAGGTYKRAIEELRRGRKTSHWMWYVFPQIAGLGQSPTSRKYAIGSLEEARAYLAHPVLGPRLLECTDAVASASSGDAEAILGGIDALKLHSSMTLFMRADPSQSRFAQVLEKFFAGVPDSATDKRL
jgi:uncharacterized protein (DUF1810 family)